MLKWLKGLTPAGRLAIATILVLVAAIVILLALPVEADLRTETDEQHGVTSQNWAPCTEMIPMVDELPRTEMVEEKGPEFDVERVKLIGRLADGIYKVRTLKGKIPFWFCGEPHEGTEARLLATDIAWHIVTASEAASDDTTKINVWELAGLASNESGFDLCSLGTFPRKAAYEYKILKRNRRTVSHTRAEVERVISHPKMKARFRAFDLCILQTLDSHYRADKMGRGERWESKDLLTWEGFRWQAEYFHGIMLRHKTDTPSLYWPGRKSPWKLAKVRRFARQLGATEEELR